MASKAPQDNEPTGHHSEFFAGAHNTTMKDMNTNSHNGQAIYSFDASTYRDNAVRNQATHGAHMTVNMPSPPAQPVPPQSHSRSSSSTRTSTRATPDRYRAPSSYYEAPLGVDTLGAVPQNPYGSRHPGHHQQHQQESNPPTPQGWGDSIYGGRGPSGLLALPRDKPLHPQPEYGLTPPQLASPGQLESLIGLGTPSLPPGHSALGGSDEVSSDDSGSVALRLPEEAEVDRRSISATPPAPSPQVAQNDVEQVQPPPAPQTVKDAPAPAVQEDPQAEQLASAAREDPQAEQPAPALQDGLHAEGAGSALEGGGGGEKAEQPKDALEAERSIPLDQRTPASGLLSLESPSRVHFNSGTSFDDQSSISDESEPEANAVPAAAPEGAQQPKLGVGKRFRLWLSGKLAGLARMVAPTEA